MYSFSGKHVLITGASGGLGSALVKRLAGSGARLVISSRSMEALHELISTLPEKGVATPITADLARTGDAIRLARQALEAMGHIDVLFNNAGIGYFALMEEATEENIRHLFQVNTFSPLSLINAVVPAMKKRRAGRIVNIASCAGRVPIPTVGVYGGSKSAFAIMTNTMRLELAPSGIDIINIYPGTVATAFEKNALREKARPGLCPKDRCGVPQFKMAERVLGAAAGPGGEVWLEAPGKWMSVAAIAWPGIVERRLASVRDQALKNKNEPPRRWRLFQVESTIDCNLKCIMCPWHEIRKGARNRGLMPPEVWRAIRPHLPQVDSVDFTGGGEPLLQPRLVQWAQEAKAAGCHAGFLTNGLLLTPGIAEQFIRVPIDWIGFSMDGATAAVYNAIRRGSGFETVCDHLKHLSGLRQGHQPKLMINFVLMPENFHQIGEIVQLAANLGVDQVNFKQCDVIRGESGKGFSLFGDRETRTSRRLERALTQARRLAKKMHLETTAFSFTPAEQPVCDQDPRHSLFIRHDGAVAPCINLAMGGATTFLGKDVSMPTIHYGCLPDDDLGAIWRSPACRFYRERFQVRVKTHEATLIRRLTRGGACGKEKTLAAARAAMPEAPDGCQVCHYLYDI